MTIVIATMPTAARADDPPSAAPGATPPTQHPPTGTFEIGASYKTDDGFGASAKVAQPDLFGTGKLLSLDATVTEREQRFTARFLDPHVLGSDVQVDTSIVGDAKHLAGFTRAALGPSISLSHMIAAHTRAYVMYRFENVTEQPDHGPARSPYDIGALRLGDEYDTLSEPFLAKHGSRVGAYIEVATAGLGSEVEEVHSKTFAETHRAIGGGMTLHLRGSLENVSSLSNQALPAGERLYFDGSSQIRGYAPNQFGPRDGTGTRLGGNFSFYGSAELEAPITHELSAVGFVDGGGLFDAHAGQLAASTGFGLIWRSPIGPIGGYLAWTAEGGPTFGFGVGPSF